MLLFLQTVNITAVLLMLFILAVILRQQPSRAQTAFILYNVFSMVFVIGIQLELVHADTVGEALSGLCVQYLGQAGLLVSLLWFISAFVKIPIPVWVYVLEAVCNTFVLIGIFTAEHHRFFYTSMEILTDGMYNRIKVGRGILWYLHFMHLDCVIFTILILCAVHYKKSGPLQKKRILYIAVGIGVLAGALLLKRGGLFGSYNPIVIAMTFCMFCMMIAMVRYHYFGSLHAAVDNAFNHGSEGLIILDREDTVVFVNHRMDALFPNIRKDSSIGSYQEIRRFMEGKEHLLRVGESVYELRMEDIIENGEKNGRMLWFVDQTQPVLTMQKLKEADEAKTQFLMRVSHELRTPMNTMLGMNEMILRESRENQVKGYAKEVSVAGEHMMSLIDEILDASRLESGTITVERKPYLLCAVLEHAEELMRPQAQKKGLSFTVVDKENVAAKNRYLIGDAAHLLQVTVNLLSNAVKYTDSGFVRLQVETRNEQGNRRLLLSVCDSGIGIEKQELARIFENFGRGSNTGGRDGMGLGLAIVKQLTEAMGGCLTVESTPGSGSVFTVFLPWIEAAEEEIATWMEETQGNMEQVKLSDFHTKTILAVDDNTNNLKVLTFLLKRTKAAVETAADGSAAVEACRRRKYDLILLDHMMPGQDGIETLRQIKEGADGKNQDTKVIALTANAGKEAKQMYLSEGFAGYMTKPVDPVKLEKLLCQCFDTQENTGLVETAQRGNPKETDWMEQLEQCGIQTQEGLRYADMDADFYRELLALFARQQEARGQNLEGILRKLQNENVFMGNGMHEGDSEECGALWNAWIAACHGLKGEARGLGAAALGGYFYQLELAGRGGDMEKINVLYPDVCDEWEKVVEGIRRALEERNGIEQR